VSAKYSSTDYLAQYRLDGAHAAITGGGSGIGRASAHALAQSGATIHVIDVDGERAATVAREIGAFGTAYAYTVDVTDGALVASAFKKIIDIGGRIDVLVNSAGIGARQPTENMPLETWQRVLAVNLDGTFSCSKAAGQSMLAAGSGAIINIASIMGMVGNTMYPNLAYNTAKGALINMTRALAVEWADRGVRVNAVAPTFARTALTEKLLADDDMVGEIEALTPLGRLAEAEDVAAAVLYLATPASAMVTGHTLAVDGGWLAR